MWILTPTKNESKAVATLKVTLELGVSLNAVMKSGNSGSISQPENCSRRARSAKLLHRKITFFLKGRYKVRSHPTANEGAGCSGGDRLPNYTKSNCILCFIILGIKSELSPLMILSSHSSILVNTIVTYSFTPTCKLSFAYQ